MYQTVIFVYFYTPNNYVEASTDCAQSISTSDGHTVIEVLAVLHLIHSIAPWDILSIGFSFLSSSCRSSEC